MEIALGNCRSGLKYELPSTSAPCHQVHVDLHGILSNSSKTIKEKTLKETLASICALLNTDGGAVEFLLNDQKSKVVPYEQCSQFIRMIEQKLISSIGTQLVTSHITFECFRDKIVCKVEKYHSLITTNYNLYVPSETQANIVPATEEVKDTILNRQHVPQPVPIGSHHKMFTVGKNCGFPENKDTEFKCLKACPSKRTTLANRMTGKGNKFSCYVSAFGNYNGGHIYFGIRDDGVVEGELISNEDIIEIKNKVEKTIKKMIWPKQIGQPKRGEHWEIFFEPVKDENSKPIPSTFVIVIYIAPCLGGVFTQEPECYEMMEGKVEKMSFATWEKRVLQLDDVDIPVAVQRIEWSSSATKRHCTEAREVLLTAINNGKWEIFSKYAKLFEDKYPEVEVKLVVLSRRVVASYRQGCLTIARLLLIDYHELLLKANEVLIFEVLYLYLKAALERVSGDSEAAWEILEGALLKADQLAPGIITAATLSSAAMNQNSGLNEYGPSSAELSMKALEH